MPKGISIFQLQDYRRILGIVAHDNGLISTAIAEIRAARTPLKIFKINYEFNPIVPDIIFIKNLITKTVPASFDDLINSYKDILYEEYGIELPISEIIKIEAHIKFILQSVYGETDINIALNKAKESMLLEIIMSLFHQGIFDPNIIASKLDFLSKNSQEIIAAVKDVYKISYPKMSYSEYNYKMSYYLFLKLKLL